MEMSNEEYIVLKTDIGEMKSDIKYLKEDKTVVRTLLDEIKALQINSAVLIEQMITLQKNYETMNENMKCIEVAFNKNLDKVSSSVCDIQAQPLKTYNVVKERTLMAVIGTTVGIIIAYIMGKLGLT